MALRIGVFQFEGRDVLGFDTGLNALAFAQAKLAQFITQAGYIVHADTSVETWQPQGVLEREIPGGREKTMVIWGPLFHGERLDLLIADDKRRDKALDALRHWVRARLVLEAQGLPSFPCPGGGFYGTEGSFLFPPDRLVKRSLEAEAAWTSGAESWVHPDLQGGEAAAFAGGAMLYRIFCGKAPFPQENTDVLRQDEREGVFEPLHLAAPGLNGELAQLITETLSPVNALKGKKRPALNDFEALLGPPGSKEAGSFFRPLDKETAARLDQEREQFNKKVEIKVKTKRFMVRNASVIGASVAAVLILSLVIRGFIKNQAELPTTQGMAPLEVAASYYGAFGPLDHTLMDACVINKAGKNDIEMVTNLYVLSRVRQAYELTASKYMSAQEWLDSGSPPVQGMVFGVSDLRLDERKKDAQEIVLGASYTLWLPRSMTQTEQDTPSEVPEDQSPQGFSYNDELRLVLHKNAWRIAEITRKDNAKF
jgi:hypothetical protein